MICFCKHQQMTPNLSRCHDTRCLETITQRHGVLLRDCGMQGCSVRNAKYSHEQLYIIKRCFYPKWLMFCICKKCIYSICYKDAPPTHTHTLHKHFCPESCKLRVCLHNLLWLCCFTNPIMLCLSPSQRPLTRSVSDYCGIIVDLQSPREGSGATDCTMTDAGWETLKVLWRCLSQSMSMAGEASVVAGCVCVYVCVCVCVCVCES